MLIERTRRIPAKTEPKISIATTSLVSQETSYLKFCPLGVYSRIAKEAGADLDFRPVGPVLTRQVHYYLVPHKDLAHIRSAQTIGKDTSLGPDIANLVNGVIGGPHIPVVLDFETIEDIFKAQQEKPHSHKAKTFGGLRNRVVKATQQLFDRFNLYTEVGLDQFLKKYGLQGFCYDTVESRSIEGMPIHEALLRRTILTHVAGLDFLKNTKETSINKILQEIYNANPNTRFVLVFNISELPDDIKKSYADVILTPEDAGPRLKPLVDSLKATLARA